MVAHMVDTHLIDYFSMSLQHLPVRGSTNANFPPEPPTLKSLGRPILHKTVHFDNQILPFLERSSIFEDNMPLVADDCQMFWVNNQLMSESELVWLGAWTRIMISVGLSLMRNGERQTHVISCIYAMIRRNDTDWAYLVLIFVVGKFPQNNSCLDTVISTPNDDFFIHQLDISGIFSDGKLTLWSVVAFLNFYKILQIDWSCVQNNEISWVPVIEPM